MKAIVNLSFFALAAISASFTSSSYAQSQISGHTLDQISVPVSNQDLSQNLSQNLIEPSVKSYPIIEAHIDIYHFAQSLMNGRLTLLYPNNKVELSVNEGEPIQFDMTQVSTGPCGVTLIKAIRVSEDLIDQVEIRDNSTMICRIYFPFKASLTWKTFSAFNTSKNIAVSDITFGRANEETP